MPQLKLEQVLCKYCHHYIRGNDYGLQPDKLNKEDYFKAYNTVTLANNTQLFLFFVLSFFFIFCMTV